MTELADNPLTSLETSIPFDRIRPEHVEPGLRALMAESAARLAALVADPAKGPADAGSAASAGKSARTFDNTLGALEEVTERLELALEVVEHLEGVATSPALRDAYAAVQPEVSAYLSSLTRNEGVWRALQELAATEEAAALQGARKRLFDKTIADFRRAGAALPAAGKARLSEIDVELARVTLRFGQNVLDSTNAFEILIDDEARLAGLPDSARQAARQSAVSKGLSGWRFTLQAPSYLPVMTYLDDAAIRERMYRASTTRGTSAEHDNRPLVHQILELRREKARLLGYATFADLVCEDRMARTGTAAREFVRGLRERTQPFFEREVRELAAFRREVEGPGAPALAPWDIAYYSEKMRRARYDYDEEALRPYFSLENVLGGVFAIAEKLYGVRVEPAQGASTWHPDVRTYLLREPDGRAGALFYVDVFPREEKRDGAWMHGLIAAVGAPRDDGRHLEVLAANFSPPVGGGAALLRHREVETLFHEFGHLMHHAASRVPIKSLAGTNVARDFVELPSQIMENWCWELPALDLFARHAETGAPLPRELFQRMVSAKNFGAALAMMRQLGFAELDLALHMDWTPEAGDVAEFARASQVPFSPAPLPPDHAMICGFSHLFSSPVGYAAGYYSYKWAEVLDADAFSRFKQEGIFDRRAGDDFRTLLSRGNSEDPLELYRGFMGREPRLDALLERDGLVGAPG
jgi:oligopeptidase A